VAEGAAQRDMAILVAGLVEGRLPLGAGGGRGGGMDACVDPLYEVELSVQPFDLPDPERNEAQHQKCAAGCHHGASTP